jgi:hypothetical protein
MRALLALLVVCSRGLRARKCRHIEYLHPLGGCVLCPSGKFGSHAGCKVCPVQYFSKHDGASVCKLCSLGFFQPKSGQDFCDTSCETGRFFDKTTVACVRCKPGSYTGDFQMSEFRAQIEIGDLSQKCVQCPAGKHQSLAGQTSCSLCATGNAFITHPLPHIALCTGLFQFAVGKASCMRCKPGSVLHGESGTSYAHMSLVCEKCPEGQYQNLLTESLKKKGGVTAATLAFGRCDRCPVGKVSTNGSSTCWPLIRCPVGQFLHITGRAAVCLNCNPGSMSIQSAPGGYNHGMVEGMSLLANVSVCRRCGPKSFSVYR